MDRLNSKDMDQLKMSLTVLKSRSQRASFKIDIDQLFQKLSPASDCRATSSHFLFPQDLCEQQQRQKTEQRTTLTAACLPPPPPLSFALLSLDFPNKPPDCAYKLLEIKTFGLVLEFEI